MTETFVFAPEIEKNVVSLCWHFPERIAALLAHFDPDIHLSQPPLRLIFEAIRLAYAELGVSDFGSVVTVLREQAKLQDAGGLEGALGVYGLDRLPNGYEFAFDHYVELLKGYARAREAKEPVYPFTGGKGTLAPNKNKRFAHDCDWAGQTRVAGRQYAVRAWMALDGSFFNLTFRPLSQCL